MWSFVYIVSFILVATRAFLYQSRDVCLRNINPCKCQDSVFDKRFCENVICKDFYSISDVQAILKMINQPLPDLHIIHNLAELPEDFFRGICVQRLILELPNQKNLPVSLLAKQSTCLQIFAVKHGRMRELPINAVLSLHILTSFHFIGNQVRELREPLWKLNLTELLLAGNNISYIHSSVFRYPGVDRVIPLVYLHIIDNNFESLNNSLLFISNLEYLSLANNKIKSLNGELVGLSKLRILKLRSNRIERLDNSLCGLSRLENLDLSQNGITILGNSLSCLSNLFNINLSYNSLTQLYDIEFKSLNRLQILDLSYNSLHALGRSLKYLKSLKILKLAGNRLSIISGSLNCVSLKELDLSHNQLTDLNFRGHLRENQCDYCDFIKYTLKKLKITGNNLHCKPKLKSILTELIQANIIVEGNPCFK